jgi:hypothetical protein
MATKGGRCLACQHPRLPELNAALASGATQAAVAAQFGLGLTSIRTHKRSHLPMSMVILGQTETARARRSVTEMAEHLSDQIEQGLEAAQAAGNPMMVGAFIREMRSLLPLLAQLAPPPAPVAIDFLASEDYRRLRSILADTLCTDCRVALAEALDPTVSTIVHGAAVSPYRAPVGEEGDQDA